MQSIPSNTESKHYPLLKNSTLQSLKRPILSTHTSLRVSNLYLILISCVIFGFHFCSAQEIKSNRQIKNNHFNLIYDPNAQKYECLIGFQINTQQKDPNSLFVSNTLKEFVPNTLKEQNAQEWINNKLDSKWKYCVIKQDIEGQSSRIIFYSRDWDQCRVKCCATVSKDQCYFKASSHQQSILNFNNLKIYLRNLQTQTLNNNQKDQPKDSANVAQNTKEQNKQELTRVGSQNNNPNGDQNSSGGSQIVMIVLLCIFGVPFTLLLFFAILSIVKLCRGESRPIIQAIDNPNPTESIIIEQINLDEYKMDEIGPYHINFLEQCSICLDENVNIRTHCGHYYHPQCIKAWMMRGKNRCPVCNCTRLNPMKVYCKKCSVGIKLVVLHGLVDDQFVTQITNLICEDCLQENKSAFSPSPSPRKQQTSIKQQSPIKQQSSIKKLNSIKELNQIKEQSPNKNSSIRKKRRRNSRVISLRSESVGEEHNQNQIQSLAIRESTDQLRQIVG